jgi:hypothetical protein
MRTLTALKLYKNKEYKIKHETWRDAALKFFDKKKGKKVQVQTFGLVKFSSKEIKKN